MSLSKYGIINRSSEEEKVGDLMGKSDGVKRGNESEAPGRAREWGRGRGRG